MRRSPDASKHIGTEAQGTGELALCVPTASWPTRYRAGCEVLAARIPQPLGVFARIAYNYRWAWDPDGPQTFAAIDPDRWEKPGREPGEAAPGGRDRPPDPLPPTTAAAGARPRRWSSASPTVRAATRATDAERPDRLFLRRVPGSHGSFPIYSGWPRRARRGHPQGGLGPGVAAGCRRSAAPASATSPSASMLAAGSMCTRSIPTRIAVAPALVTGDDGEPITDHGADRRLRGCYGADLVRPASAASRSTCSMPSARRTTTVAKWITVAALHRRRGHAPGAGHAARHRRRPGARGNGHRARPRAPQRGPRGVRVTQLARRSYRRARLAVCCASPAASRRSSPPSLVPAGNDTYPATG